MKTEGIERLKVVCTKIATGKADQEYDYKLYESLRGELLKDSSLSQVIPSSIQDSSDGEAFFRYLQALASSYRERREIIHDVFAPLEEKVEEMEDSRLLDGFAKQMEKVNSNFVKENWRKMIERADSDPSGCITSARGLLESTLKHILRESDIEVKKNPDIGNLFHEVRKVLFPNFPKETEEIKRIIRSMAMVIDKIKLVRDEYGDAHGHLDGDGNLEPLFAVYIANMSGSICGFLIDAHELYKK